MENAKLCNKCKSPLQPSETFCPKCGEKFLTQEEEFRGIQQRMGSIQEKQDHLRKIKTGRGWILAVAIMTFLFGIGQFFSSKSSLQKDIDQVESQIRTFDAEQKADFDQRMKEQSGMNWEEAKKQGRGEIQMLLVINLILAGAYFGMWFWAKSNPFTASLIALIIYITILALNLTLFAAGPKDPSATSAAPRFGIGQIFCLIALGSAVSASYKYRKAVEASS